MLWHNLIISYSIYLYEIVYVLQYYGAARSKRIRSRKNELCFPHFICSHEAWRNEEKLE
jgi:hypothetical protein